MTIATDKPFTEQQQHTLQAVAGTMIPASPDHNLPGADDPAIFRTIIDRASRMPEAIHPALAQVDDMAGGSYTAADPAVKLAVLNRLQQEHPALAGALVSAVAPSYYEDDRVLTSVGYPARPPFPEGHEVEPGDWSLLDPVRARGPFYRKVTG